MVLSVVGGIFILLGGITLLFVGAILAALLGAFVGSFSFLGPDPIAIVNTMGILGVVFGLIDMALGIVMFVKPGLSKVLGAVVLVVSLVSIIALGGFFLGLILGVVGGILGLLWKPSPEATAAYQPAMAPPPQ
ncbi:MAG TPA: DUF6114 domain-containing protein [Thermoplasmata archaeon]|jgi:hypothetical protein|nr:DUF6114 domain-containing protein [Thermoplasmata archaeon]